MLDGWCNFNLGALQLCLVERSVMMEIQALWCVQFGSHELHIAIDHLKCDEYNWENDF